MKRLTGFGLMGAAGFMIAIIGVPVLAGTDGKHRGGMFWQLDANKDGSITSDEVTAAQGERFQRLDIDRDGVLTEDEMLAAAQARVARRTAKRFARMDQNGDGRIEQAEYEERGVAHFTRLDIDGDGQVTREEAHALRHKRRHGKHENGSPDN